MCPHWYSTQSGACSRHTAHSLDELSSDSVFDPTTSAEGPDGGGARVTLGPDGVTAAAADCLRGIVATGWDGGDGKEVTPPPAANDCKVDNTCGSTGGSFLAGGSFLSGTEWWERGRGCFGGRDGGSCDEVERIIGGGRGGGESPVLLECFECSERLLHCGGPFIIPGTSTFKAFTIQWLFPNLLRTFSPRHNKCSVITTHDLIAVIIERLVYKVVHKKHDTLLLSISLPTIDQFSKFFHWHTLQAICNNVIIMHPTTTQIHLYTTLWNINVRKN